MSYRQIPGLVIGKYYSIDLTPTWKGSQEPFTGKLIESGERYDGRPILIFSVYDSHFKKFYDEEIEDDIYVYEITPASEAEVRSLQAIVSKVKKPRAKKAPSPDVTGVKKASASAAAAVASARAAAANARDAASSVRKAVESARKAAVAARKAAANARQAEIGTRKAKKAAAAAGKTRRH